MIIRNGIKSNLRAKGRTALFFALILLFTVASVLGLGVRLYCDNALSQCDAQYRSIGVIEYMGADYPDENAADPAARSAKAGLDIPAILSVDGVKSFDGAASSLKYLEDFSLRSSLSKYSSYGIIEVSGISQPQYRSYWVEDEPAEEEEGETGESPEQGHPQTGISLGTRMHLEYDTSKVFYYSVRLSRTLFAQSQKEKIILNVMPGETGWEPQPGERYVLHGIFLRKNEVEGMPGGVQAFELLPIEGYDGEPYEKCEDGDPVPEIFARTAEKYTLCNNYITAYETSDIGNLFEFHQGYVYMEEGRLPLPGQAGACVISPDIADKTGLSVGDSLQLRELISAEDDRYDLSAGELSDPVTIAGITNRSGDYASRIWIVTDAGTAQQSPLFGFHLGTVTLENSAATEAVEELQELMPERVRVQLYDQGYAEAAGPFDSMRSTANNVLLICGAGITAVLVLYAFLFVSRQKYTVKILISLGTPTARIALWFISGTLAVSGSAAAAGALIGRFGLPYLFEKLEQSLADKVQISTLYSETVLGISKEAAISTDAGYGGVWAAAAVIIAAALILTLAFLPSAFREGTLRRGRSRVRVPHGRTSLAGRGGLRFAALSILRGGRRTVVVPVVSAVLTLVVIVLGGIYLGWQDRLTDAFDTTVIDGIAVSTNGRYYSGLLIPAENVRQLYSVKDVDRVWVSTPPMHYWSDAEMPTFGTSGFAYESRKDWVFSQPEIVPLNSLHAAKEFYYEEPVVTWAEGFDESLLESEMQTYIEYVLSLTPTAPGPDMSEGIKALTVPAVVGDGYMADHGLSLGDTFDIRFYEDRFFQYGNELPVTVKIAGAYRQMQERAQIYVPLSFAVPPDVIYTQDAQAHKPQDRFIWQSYTQEEILENHYYFKTVFSTCRFTLGSARDLDDARQSLSDMGFSRVGKIRPLRTTLVLRDSSFLKLTETLQRYMHTGRLILLMISLVIVITGFIISWLMINTRGREFALMRGLGAGRLRIFLSFFLEQALLCIVGCAAGCAAMAWLGRGALQWALAGGFVCFYLLGCMISILIIGRSRLMALLAGRE